MVEEEWFDEEADDKRGECEDKDGEERFRDGFWVERDLEPAVSKSEVRDGDGCDRKKHRGEGGHGGGRWEGGRGRRGSKREGRSRIIALTQGERAEE